MGARALQTAVRAGVVPSPRSGGASGRGPSPKGPAASAAKGAAVDRRRSKRAVWRLAGGGPPPFWMRREGVGGLGGGLGRRGGGCPSSSDSLDKPWALGLGGYVLQWPGAAWGMPEALRNR